MICPTKIQKSSCGLDVISHLPFILDPKAIEHQGRMAQSALDESQRRQAVAAVATVCAFLGGGVGLVGCYGWLVWQKDSADTVVAWSFH